MATGLDLSRFPEMNGLEDDLLSVGVAGLFAERRRSAEADGGEGLHQPEAQQEDGGGRAELPVKKARNVKALLEKLSEFLTENNLEEQIEEERKDIRGKIEVKNEEISQKRETHRHKLNEIHETYKLEIQRENERHLDDLKVTECDIISLRQQVLELEQLNVAVTSKIPCSKSNSGVSDRDRSRVRDLLECPVCLEVMRPPKKIFQCSNGHVICEPCKSNPEVRSCPTCRVKFRGHNVVRNIVAENLARNTYDSSDSDESISRPSNTRESNPVEYSASPSDDLQVPVDIQMPDFGDLEIAYDFGEDIDDRDTESDNLLHRIFGSEDSGSALNQHRRLTDDGQQQQQQQQGRYEVSGSLRNPIRLLPRLREREEELRTASRVRSRYIPHHMRRQRTGREQDEVDQEDELDRRPHILERLLESSDRVSARGPRAPRRSENRYPILR